jgi:thiosulfate/3-mercaptopyruvate sulfurtransferase
LASGHIPNSLSAPFLNYLSPPSDTKPYTSYKSLEELKEVLTKAVGGQAAWDALVKGDKGLVFTCGSGMTAAIGWLANELIRAEQGGNVKSSIYDEVSGDSIENNWVIIADTRSELDWVRFKAGE